MRSRVTSCWASAFFIICRNQSTSLGWTGIANIRSVPFRIDDHRAASIEERRLWQAIRTAEFFEQRGPPQAAPPAMANSRSSGNWQLKQPVKGNHEVHTIWFDPVSAELRITPRTFNLSEC